MIGRSLNHYRVLAPLGRGGMGHLAPQPRAFGNVHLTRSENAVLQRAHTLPAHVVYDALIRMNDQCLARQG